MFFENLNYEEWDFKPLNETKVVKSTVYGIAKKSNSENIGTPMLRSGQNTKIVLEVLNKDYILT